MTKAMTAWRCDWSVVMTVLEQHQHREINISPAAPVPSWQVCEGFINTDHRVHTFRHTWLWGLVCLLGHLYVLGMISAKPNYYTPALVFMWRACSDQWHTVTLLSAAVNWGSTSTCLQREEDIYLYSAAAEIIQAEQRSRMLLGRRVWGQSWRLMSVMVASLLPMVFISTSCPHCFLSQPLWAKYVFKMNSINTFYFS